MYCYDLENEYLYTEKKWCETILLVNITNNYKEMASNTLNSIKREILKG